MLIALMKLNQTSVNSTLLKITLILTTRADPAMQVLHTCIYMYIHGKSCAQRASKHITTHVHLHTIYLLMLSLTHAVTMYASSHALGYLIHIILECVLFTNYPFSSTN